MTQANLASLIDHTLLKPDASESQIRTLCAEALHYQFASVCVNPTWVALCAELLAGSEVKACTVIGFPLGATLTAVKAFEACEVLRKGAQEVDMVINVGLLKSGHLSTVQEDIAAVVSATQEHQGVVKVIIETALLSEDEKVVACELALDAGADFVKTCTGFSGGGATIEDIMLMRRVVGDRLGVKAAGGIRTAGDARAMVASGATRLGTSAGVSIVREALGYPDDDAGPATRGVY